MRHPHRRCVEVGKRWQGSRRRQPGPGRAYPGAVRAKPPEGAPSVGGKAEGAPPPALTSALPWGEERTERFNPAPGGL